MAHSSHKTSFYEQRYTNIVEKRAVLMHLLGICYTKECQEHFIKTSRKCVNL